MTSTILGCLRRLERGVWRVTGSKERDVFHVPGGFPENLTEKRERSRERRQFRESITQENDACFKIDQRATSRDKGGEKVVGFVQGRAREGIQSGGESKRDKLRQKAGQLVSGMWNSSSMVK
jgi:hypothetical protein